MNTKEVMVAIRFEKSLIERLRKYATDNNKCYSEIVRKLIEDFLKKKGF